MTTLSVEQFISLVPKAELHLHIEGTLEPELMFTLAERNGISLPFKSVDEVRDAYCFQNLQEFLDIYYSGASVLLFEQDFYDLTWSYLLRIKEDNVVHTEIFFDPQTHTDRGVEFSAVIEGIYRALRDGEEQLGISFKLIMSWLRHLSEEAAFKTLEEALPYSHMIDAVGLDSSEVGNPPEKFQRVFAKAKEIGFLAVAHAGEEGPAQYIWDSLELLDVDRVDHGNSSLLDPSLMAILKERQMPLTLCPLSNLSLKVITDLAQFPLRPFLDAGLLITVNSDDPAYFGGYMNDNFTALVNAIGLTKDEVRVLAINSIKASWLSSGQKEQHIADINSI